MPGDEPVSSGRYALDPAGKEDHGELEEERRRRKIGSFRRGFVRKVGFSVVKPF